MKTAVAHRRLPRAPREKVVCQVLRCFESEAEAEEFADLLRTPAWSIWVYKCWCANWHVKAHQL